VAAIPSTFRAFVAERVADDRVERGLREAFPAGDLPDGDIEVRVDWSSVNYKDALATTAAGKVARISPIIPGIDLAGVVVASSSPSFAAPLLISHSRAARSRAADTEIFLRRASRPCPVLSSGETRQL